jgi:serine/threonine-protein kinase
MNQIINNPDQTREKRSGLPKKVLIVGCAVLTICWLGICGVYVLFGGEIKMPSFVPRATLSVSELPDGTLTPFPTEITDIASVVMRLVPAGEFTMGSDVDDALAECLKYRNDCRRDWFLDQDPSHPVYLDDFYMDQYEVTNVQYKACVDAGYCSPPKEKDSITRSSYYGNSEFDDYPVIYIDWNQAKTYCEWRGIQLPTEAQWEKAARGGLDGKSYPWGDEAPVCEKGVENGAKFDDQAGCNNTDTEVVGSYSPNGYGLYDMAGNVWEWVSSDYQPYPYVSTDGREDGYPSRRVMRGGAWTELQISMIVSARYNPSSPYLYGVGFRCARNVTP